MPVFPLVMGWPVRNRGSISSILDLLRYIRAWAYWVPWDRFLPRHKWMKTYSPNNIPLRWHMSLLICWEWAVRRRQIILLSLSVCSRTPMQWDTADTSACCPMWRSVPGSYCPMTGFRSGEKQSVRKYGRIMRWSRSIGVRSIVLYLAECRILLIIFSWKGTVFRKERKIMVGW